jgi:hypothetical protein
MASLLDSCNGVKYSGGPQRQQVRQRQCNAAEPKKRNTDNKVSTSTGQSNMYTDTQTGHHSLHLQYLFGQWQGYQVVSNGGQCH